MTLSEWASTEPRCTPQFRKYIEEIEADDDHQFVQVLVCFDDPPDVSDYVSDWREQNAKTKQKGVMDYLNGFGHPRQFSIINAISITLPKTQALTHLLNIGHCEPKPVSFDHLAPLSMH